MSLEQLQDYAKTLEDSNAVKDSQIEELTTKNKEVNELNLDLQKRNLSLFKQVEQRPTDQEKKEEEQKPQQVSCEDFASKNYKEIL